MTPTADELLRRRARHYWQNYAPARVRELLIEDGFDAAAIDRALAELVPVEARDVYGAGVLRTSRASVTIVSATATVLTCLVVTLVDGVFPWTLMYLGGVWWAYMPFAGLGALVGLELYAFVKTRYDFPNVSRGIGAGMFAGPVLFFVLLGYVFSRLL